MNFTKTTFNKRIKTINRLLANNKISLEDYPIDLVNLDEILEESHHI